MPCRQRAIVTCVHRLEHVERFALHLDIADDDAIGAHAGVRYAPSPES